MGREIVYCWKCSTRLQSSDFEQGKAYRVDDKMSCGDCIFDLVADLPAEEQEAILNPPPPTAKKTSTTRITAVKAGGTTSMKRGTGPVPKAGGTQRIAAGAKAGTRSIPRTSTRSIPRVEDPELEEGIEDAGGEPAPKKGKGLLIGGIAGGLLVVVVLVVLLSGGKSKKELAADAAAAEAAKAASEAKGALDAARQFVQKNPEDIAGQLRRFRDAVKLAEGTDAASMVAGAARPVIEGIVGRLKDKLISLEAENKPMADQELFGAAVSTWEKELKKYDVPEWREPVEKKILDLKERAKAAFEPVRKAAVEDAKKGDKDKVQEARDKVARWEIKELADAFEKAVAEAAPDTSGAKPAVAANPEKTDTPDAPDATPPKPEENLSPAMKEYVGLWQKAAGVAFGRDFDQAKLELTRGAKNIDDDQVRKETAADVARFDQMKAFVEESLKVLPKIPRLQSLTLEHQSKPGEFAKVTGKVMKVDDQRVELAVDSKEKPRQFVEFWDLSAGALHEQGTARGGKPDAVSAALLALIEGNLDAAKKLAARNAGKIPARYWAYAPEAKDKAHKPSSREFEARALYHQAELEWRDIKTWGGAIDKYRILTNDYATTAYVRRNQSAIVKRGEVGKEYVYFPPDMKATGALNKFKLQTHPKFDPAKVAKAWVNTDEVDANLSLENYVEVEWYAMPNLTYKCWIYMGGCCEDTFAVYYQTTEATTTVRSKQVPIDPGSRYAEPLRHGIPNLRKEHRLHVKKPTDPNPKEPAIWAWVQVPLPKYQAPGPKGLRLTMDQPGFAVAYVIVTSKPMTVPSEQQTKDYCRDAASAQVETPKLKGTAEAREWLIAGPFDPGLGTAQAPEQGIDLVAEMKGKGTAKVKWKTATATIKGSQAEFLWEDGKTFTPKENVSAYALIHVKAPSAMDAQLFISHDDGGKAWLNGAVVHDNNRDGGIKPDEFKKKIKLEEGWNRLLVKVRTGTGGFGFTMRIVDAGGNAIPGLEYHPFGDELESK
jgi:hypothetical protein